MLYSILHVCKPHARRLLLGQDSNSEKRVAGRGYGLVTGSFFEDFRRAKDIAQSVIDCACEKSRSDNAKDSDWFGK